MSNGRNGLRKGKRSKVDVDGSSWFAMPTVVLDSAAFQGLSSDAKAMMWEVARQYHGDDNGRMLLSRSHLAPRGWLSNDKIQRAKEELLAAGLIYQTVVGYRPNKASWYAATWWALDKLDGFDMGAQAGFERSAYKHVQAKPKRAAPKCGKASKHASLTPVAGTEGPPIAPATGTEGPLPVPAIGAISPVFACSPVPAGGHPLESHLPAFDGGAVPADVRPVELGQTGTKSKLATPLSLIDQARARAAREPATTHQRTTP